MKSFILSTAAFLLALSTSLAPVAAQNTTAIPSDVSATCSTFLSTLNSDAELDACTKPLLAATKYYSSNSTNSTTQLDSTLADLCSSNTGCDADIIRQRLDQFWQNCQTDLQNKITAVQTMYDNLYMITPLVNSICSKDTNNDYCLKTIAKEAASSSNTSTTTTNARRSLEEEGEEEEAEETISELYKRQSTDNLDGLANETETTGTSNTNAAFLFISSSSPKSVLCSTCTQLILASYIKFETSIPYAIGLRTSDILAPQSDIYKAAKTHCGLNFVAQVNKIANTTQFAAVVSGAAFTGAKGGFVTLVTLIASAVVAFVAL
ncbi:uncharacterized protein MEPE_01967 [Melanopsichium pennsylvanicum]|uniref:DUF7729 domain-containing protein n=1 Tax=Melanopsichium pennsylvanicum TaxID=63383 RepID=A0AAJ4XJD8_9BASI|nr:uncharacterized protein MEPE_01967 [Melanopsichium pennsylvanicum]